MNGLKKLFDEENAIQEAVKRISHGVLDLSDYVLSKSAIELAEAQVVGKNVRKACDDINEHVHKARKVLGALLTDAVRVQFKGKERALHEIENELSLIHGDLEAIGSIAERFYDAKDRKAAFENLNQHYSELVRHLTSLMLEEASLK
ncbi:MAG: hypothetical protein QW165_01670 [Candidatus Woesearchaeota archaeon]